MNVVKSTIRPCSTRAHLLCVPGRTASTPSSSGATAPSNCVSSPRMTSGVPATSRVVTPGTIASASSGACTIRSDSAVSDAGQSTYGASTQPWRLPIIPHATRGALFVVQSPSSVANAVSNRPSRTCRTPSGTLRRSSTPPLPSTQYARAADVPQSIATSAVADKSSLPALRGFVVARACLDPALAVGQALFFPEGCARLQDVHRECAGIERHAPVRAGDDDENDLVARPQCADPVDDQHIADVEATLRFVDDGLERRLGHPGIVLEREPADDRVVVDVANGADERGDGADGLVVPSQPRDFRANIEILDLHANGQLRTPTLAALAAALPPVGALFAPWGGPAVLN